jgi:uncharacterized MAPEG superfamily protein
MTIAFWCVLVAGLLPYCASWIAKSKKGFDNASPRDWLDQQEGFRARANAAQLNSFEVLPLFAAAVIIAHLRSAPQHTIDLLAIGFIVARVVYIGLYVANLASLRSLSWLVGLVCVVAMFFVGA